MTTRAPITSLSIMMFLQFFIWGAWYVTVGNFLGVMGKTTQDPAAWDLVGTVYSLCPIAAIISPVFLGMVADRFFASQKVLGVMHGLGAVLMFLVAQHVTGDNPDPDTFVWLLLAYALCYMPTMGLTNTVAFTHITDQEKQFPLVRVFGTIGWIVAGVVVSMGLRVDSPEATVELATQQFWVAAGSSAALAVFSFTLPATPPPLAGKQVAFSEAMGLGALNLMRRPSFAVFIICSFLVCIPLMAYYSFTPVFLGECGFENPGASMSWGQVAEVFFMLVMPLCFARLGVKSMIAVGVLAWVVRYVLFSLGGGEDLQSVVPWMLMIGIVLHGICYDFFFVTGQIYVDKTAPAAIRGQAQGFLVLMTLGLGSWVGSHAAGYIVKQNEPVIREARIKEVGRLNQQLAPLKEIEAPTPAQLDEIEELEAHRAEAAAEGRIDWRTVWAIPAGGAALILLVFLLLFREPRGEQQQVDADL